MYSCVNCPISRICVLLHDLVVGMQGQYTEVVTETTRTVRREVTPPAELGQPAPTGELDSLLQDLNEARYGAPESFSPRIGEPVPQFNTRVRQIHTSSCSALTKQPSTQGTFTAVRKLISPFQAGEPFEASARGEK